MTNNGALESFEIERKYEVTEAHVLPGQASFAEAGLRLEPSHAHDLRAEYFDTPDIALASRRLALRKRVGGKDEGWHLKAKGDDGARELLWPLADEMPEGAKRELEDRIGASEIVRLRAIATLRTRRSTALLLTPDGTPAVELADDRVDAVNDLTGRRQQWREWEAELMPGADAAVLDLIEPLLIAAGAVRVRGTSKIQRTMQAETADAADARETAETAKVAAAADTEGATA